MRTQDCLLVVTTLFVLTLSGCHCKAPGGATCNIALANDSALACSGAGTKVAANIPVTANDTLGTGTPTVTITTQGTLGTAAVNADNTITYTATDPASTGEDTFTYQVCTQTSCCETATVTVLLDDQTPAGEDFSAPTVTIGTSTTIELSAHVTPLTAGLTYAIDTTGTLGTATVNPTTGVVSYTAPATLPSSGGAPQTLNVPADTTWRAIGPVGDLTGPPGINGVGLAWEASHTGWNTNLAFDDSDAAGWTNLKEVTHPNPPTTRFWVDGTDIVGSSPAYFRKEFFINGTPTAGAFFFSVDDDAQVYVNGTKLIDDASGLASDFPSTNALPNLVPGWNLIAIKAHDQQGAQAILFNLNITFDPAGTSGTDTFTYTATDACGNTSVAATVTVPLTAPAATRLALATSKVMVVNNSSSEITVYVGGAQVDVVQPRGSTIVPRSVAAGADQEILVQALNASPASNGDTTATADLLADEAYTITYNDDGTGNRTISVTQ